MVELTRVGMLTTRRDVSPRFLLCLLLTGILHNGEGLLILLQRAIFTLKT